MTSLKTSNNQENQLFQLHKTIRNKLTNGLADSESYLDDIFDDLDNEELALLAAKVNNKLNRRLNHQFDF